MSLAIVVVALLASWTAASSSASQPDWYQHLSIARAAIARDDLDAALPELLAVDSLVGGHSGAMFALAQIAARRGAKTTALRHLSDFAATGVTRHLRGDTTFALLEGDPTFEAIVARLDSNATPISKAEVAARFDDAGLLAEDLAWDGRRRRFLVSSIHRRKIVALNAEGVIIDFANAGPGTWGFYGLAIDAARARLWATTAASPTSEGFDAADSGRTAIVAFDLSTAKPVVRVELPRDGARHVLGDLTLGRDGTVYVTESLGGGVYRLRPGKSTLDTLAAPGIFHSPQMPVVSSDGRRLLIAEYARGIAALEIGSGRVTWLAKPRTLASGGIDGLYRDGRKLIAIQNGTTPHRVLELTLDPSETRITAWQVLERASEWLGEPNHGTFVGKNFYFIGNSGWDRVSDAEILETPADARPPVLLRLQR
jgi:sugar lactone lactonase YvrE